MNLLDLSSTKTYDRFFVIGALQGDYHSLIDILYDQLFTHRDCLVLTGNFLNLENFEQHELLNFLQHNENCFSVLGRNEASLLEYSMNGEPIPEYLESLLDEGGENFLSALPLVIKLPDNFVVVNSGVEPFKTLQEQDSKVFYSIQDYDPESRYYQFFNPEKKSWFEFSFEGMKICFSHKSLELHEVPAGYNLGDASYQTLAALVIARDDVALVTL